MNKCQPGEAFLENVDVKWQQPTNCLSVFDHFVRLEFKINGEIFSKRFIPSSSQIPLLENSTTKLIPNSVIGNWIQYKTLSQKTEDNLGLSHRFLNYQLNGVATTGLEPTIT